MKSINLTRNGQTINITESGEAIVDGRKYKVDVDFSTGTVELTYMCQDDGTLSAEFAFSKIVYSAEKKTTPNTSIGKKPRLTGGSCYLEDSNDCFKCLSEDEKGKISAIATIRENFQELDIDDLVAIAQNTAYAAVETIKARKDIGTSAIYVILADVDELTSLYDDGVYSLQMAHNQNGTDVTDIYLGIGNTVVNQLFSYIINEVSKIVPNNNIVSFMNNAIDDSDGFMDGIDTSFLETSKYAYITSTDIEETIKMMQLLRYVDSVEYISISVNGSSITLELKKVDDVYNVYLNSSEIGEDAADNLRFLYKAFMSILSIDSLEEVQTFDEEGNLIDSYFVDNTDFEYKYIESYFPYAYAESGYVNKLVLSINYVADGYCDGYFCSMGDEMSKYEDVDYVADGYAEDGAIQKSDKVLKDKTNKILENIRFSESKFLDLSPIKFFIDGIEVYSEEDVNDTTNAKKVDDNESTLNNYQIFTQGFSSWIKEYVVKNEYINIQLFTKLLNNGATIIKGNNIDYHAGSYLKGEFEYLLRLNETVAKAEITDHILLPLNIKVNAGEINLLGGYTYDKELIGYENNCKYCNKNIKAYGKEISPLVDEYKSLKKSLSYMTKPPFIDKLRLLLSEKTISDGDIKSTYKNSLSIDKDLLENNILDGDKFLIEKIVKTYTEINMEIFNKTSLFIPNSIKSFYGVIDMILSGNDFYLSYKQRDYTSDGITGAPGVSGTSYESKGNDRYTLDPVSGSPTTYRDFIYNWDWNTLYNDVSNTINTWRTTSYRSIEKEANIGKNYIDSADEAYKCRYDKETGELIVDVIREHTYYYVNTHVSGVAVGTYTGLYYWSNTPDIGFNSSLTKKTKLIKREPALRKYSVREISEHKKVIKYFITTNKDKSVTISWENSTDIDAKFFQFNDKKIKVGD